MKIQKFISFIFIFIFAGFPLFSQEFEVPATVKLESAEDYKRYEAEVLQGINWLEKTRVEEQTEKRQNTNAFLMQWMSGTPDVSIGLEAFQLALTNKNPDLLITFLGGWTRFSLKNPDQKDNSLLTNEAGIKSILKVYKMNIGKGMKKDKRIERLLRKDDQELLGWIRDQLN